MHVTSARMLLKCILARSVGEAGVVFSLLMGTQHFASWELLLVLSW